MLSLGIRALIDGISTTFSRNNVINLIHEPILVKEITIIYIKKIRFSRSIIKIIYSFTKI